MDIVGGFQIPKTEQKQALLEKCPSLFIREKFKQIGFAHDYGTKDRLVKAMYPMGPFEHIINAENDAFSSFPTFKVRDKPFFLEPNAMKALRKQRLLENIFMESQMPSHLSARPNMHEGDMNRLIDGLLEC